MKVLNGYLNEVKKTLKGTDNDKILGLGKILNLKPENNQYIVLINLIKEPLERKDIEEKVKGCNFFNNKWKEFNEIICEFIFLCNRINAWSKLESFDLYVEFFNKVCNGFINNKGYLLSNVVKDLIYFIKTMLKYLDEQFFQTDQSTKPRTNFMANGFFKIFKNIRTVMNDPGHFKQKLFLYICNTLFGIYFYLNNPLFCRNLILTRDQTNVVFDSFPHSEKLQYRFYVSKYYMMNDQLMESYIELLWCLENCNFSSLNNATLILKLLFPVSLSVGKKPNFAYIYSKIYRDLSLLPRFFELYISLTKAIDLGSFLMFAQVVHENYVYLKDMNVLLLLVNKCKIIILRNIIKKLWNISQKPYYLDFDSVKIALLVSIGDNQQFLDLIYPIIKNKSDIDDLVIENLFISLIYQNLLRGKILPRLRKVTLSKTNVFPLINDVYFSSFLSDSYKNNWMVSVV